MLVRMQPTGNAMAPVQQGPQLCNRLASEQAARNAMHARQIILSSHQTACASCAAILARKALELQGIQIALLSLKQLLHLVLASPWHYLLPCNKASICQYSCCSGSSSWYMQL